jgi:hypothetical protein
VHGKSPTPADRRRGIRQDGVPCRHPDALPRPFEDEEKRGGLPGPGEREERDCGEHPVANERDRPVVPRGIGQVPGGQAQGVAKELTEPRDHPDGESAGTEDVEVGAGDAPCPFVDDIPKEAYDAEEDDHGVGCTVFAVH